MLSPPILTDNILIDKIATQHVTTIKWIFISFNIKWQNIQVMY
jgi:hypothetical protein